MSAPVSTQTYPITVKSITNQRTMVCNVGGGDTVRSLQERIHVEFGLPPLFQCLICNGARVQLEQTLAQAGIGRDAVVHVMIQVGGKPQNVLWAPFIKSITRTHSLSESACASVRVTFQPSEGHTIDLSSFSRPLAPMQNLWPTYLAQTHGAEKAASFFWSSHIPSSRALLLELSEEFTKEGKDGISPALEREKYKFDGINRSYYGGDSRSWQRYTRSLPVAGTISVDPHTLVMEWRSSEALKPATWYAFLLVHSNHMCSSSIYEDHLVPFQTAPAAPTLRRSSRLAAAAAAANC
jgi:hypothetical protein